MHCLSLKPSRAHALSLTVAVMLLAWPIAALAESQIPSRPAERITLNARVIPVGKWAEGLALERGRLWVAESGQRTIAEVGIRDGRVRHRSKVGRLPVAMVSGGNGAVYALVHTDQLIWRQPAERRKGKRLTRLDECPETMIASGRYLWALTLPKCSSESSRIVRVHRQTGQQKRSAVLGEWGQALAAHKGEIWVAHAREPALTVVDKTTFRAETAVITDASFWSIASGGAHIFAGGRLDGSNAIGIVSMIDPHSRGEIARAQVDQRVAEIATHEHYVVALGEKGRIWVYSNEALYPMRTIDLDIGAFDPRGLLIDGNRLYITVGQYRGENGAVLVVDGWQPEG